MSARTELSRVAAPKPNALTKAKAELASKASKLLGYTALQTEVGDIRVRAVFAELGVEPLNETKVEHYKDKRAKGEAQWQKTRLSDYRNEVPMFAISRAVELKERLPEAEFYVDHLVYAPKNRDPFLVMRVNQQLYYLDVWEEPEFEGRRVV